MDDEEKKAKYKRLVSNLWSIHGSYSDAINKVTNLKGEIKNGIKLDDEVVDKDVVEDALNNLNTSKSNIASIIYGMRSKT